MKSLIKTFKFCIFIMFMYYVAFCTFGGPFFMYLDGTKWYYCVLMVLPLIHLIANQEELDGYILDLIQ